MAAGNTYEAIATTTLGSATSNVTFSSVPSTYTDLVLIVNGRSDYTSGQYEALYMQVNSDTSTNYSATFIMGGEGNATSSRQTSQNQMEITRFGNSYLGATAFGVSIIQLQNYSNTTTYKTCLGRTVNQPYGYNYTGETICLWRSTAAISTIKVYPALGSNFVANTQVSLYGIKAA